MQQVGAAMNSRQGDRVARSAGGYGGSTHMRGSVSNSPVHNRQHRSAGALGGYSYSNGGTLVHRSGAGSHSPVRAAGAQMALSRVNVALLGNDAVR